MSTRFEGLAETAPTPKIAAFAAHAPVPPNASFLVARVASPDLPR
jgi:hypothetical protein